MLHPESLIKKTEGWQFASEADLEDFVWDNLEKLFGLSPLKRQYVVQNDCCDILALSDSGQLVIIELKNVEDRYVVQQLTRYYHSLSTQKPMAEIIQYDHQPIRLIAIKPDFHRHNHIDRIYNKLKVEFWQFEIIQNGKQLTFHIKDQEESSISSVIIPYPQEYILDEITTQPTLRILPRITRAFEKLLDERHPSDKELVLRIREKILGFDERMAEVSTKVITRYGYPQKNGSIPTTKICAEFYSRPINDFHILEFSLWLPIPNQRYVARKIYLKKDVKILVWGFNKENSKLALNVLRNPDPKSSRHSESYSLNQYAKIYKLMTGEEFTDKSLEGLIEIALADWQERVDGRRQTITEIFNNF